MELVFPLAIYVGVPFTIVLLFIGRKKKSPYTQGKKVANTSFVEDTPLYKQLLQTYKCFRFLALGSLWIAIILGVIMLARPARIEKINPDIHNRDIFICMDISDSVDELNLQICDKLREVVNNLDGERFGISIFNGRSVLLVPLTTDYEYVMETLNKLEASFDYSINRDFENEDWDLYSLYMYKHEGTMSDYGSSFIGDGLASCLYSFPDLTENTERSRLIIFTTDNELNGTPLVTVEEAAALCRKNDVKVFAVTPEDIIDQESFQKAMNSTGGGYYECSSPKIFDELTEDIKLTETSAMEDIRTVITDQPKVLFILLLIAISAHFIFSRKVKL